MIDFNYEKLIKAARDIGITLDSQKAEAFACYYSLLIDWNSKINLTRVPPQETIDRHFLDSLSVAKVYKFKGVQSLIDVGTGAGFPGMALKIAFPDLKVTLMDSVKKKLSFLEDVVKHLGLRDVELLHGRAEDVGRDPKYREKFDVVTARAVSELKVLLELTFPFVRVRGRVLLWKGVDVENEIKAAKGALKALGIDKATVERCNLGKNQGTIIHIVKQSQLSKDFPRSPKKISSNPL